MFRSFIHLSLFLVSFANLSAEPFVIKLEPTEDTHAMSHNPEASVGSYMNIELRASEGSPFARVAYLKFKVDEFEVAPTKATIRFYSHSLTAPIGLYAVSDNSWDEDSLNWSNRPALGQEIGSGNTEAESWTEIDVTHHFNAPGTYSIALDEESNSVGVIHSKESSNSPELILEFPHSELTQEEVTTLENAFGIVLTQEQKNLVANATKPVYRQDNWFAQAFERINQHRSSQLDIEVLDANGTPIPEAEVSVELTNPDFKWGATVDVRHLTNANDELNFEVEEYRNILKMMFNSLGFNNALKPRITGHHQYIPNFLEWAKEQQIPVRGHLLIWPGTGTEADLDDSSKELGVDYASNLSNSWTSDFATHDVLSAVETYRDSSRAQQDRDALAQVARDEIVEWVKQWDVYEWDVINEPLSNTLLTDIIGEQEMAHWFNLAQEHKVSEETTLMMNDFLIISAHSPHLHPTFYSQRRDAFMQKIDRVIEDGGALGGIGFQSRIRFEKRSPQLIWERLKEWGDRYERPMAGTEFEVKDSSPDTQHFPYVFSDQERAQITAEMMTQYYSHPLVTGLTAWDFLHDDTSALFDTSGQANVTALVWYYMRHIAFGSSERAKTDMDGHIPSVQAFHGDYAIKVTYEGQEYELKEFIQEDTTLQVHLEGVVLNDPPAWKRSPYQAPSGIEGQAYRRHIGWLATDKEDDDLTFSSSDLPSWATLHPTFGRISGTPTFSDVGLNEFSVEVSDGVNAPVTNQISILIEQAPLEELLFEDFESGFGVWVDGGDDAQISSQNAIDQQCLFLRDNSSSSEVILREPLDLTSRRQLQIEFSYVALSFEGAEDFWVSYSADGGATWQRLKTFVNDVDFVDNGTRYNPVMTFDNSDLEFTNDVSLKFECDASGNQDRLYIDNIKVLAR